MASLLERMNVPAGAGPVRTKSNNGRSSASPYSKDGRPPKGDSNGTWKHDLYATNTSLSARLSNPSAAGSSSVPKMNFASADRALKDALGLPEGGLSIKGASSRGNVVQVSNLAKGTTAADVEAIFKRCGPIMSCAVHPTPASTPSTAVRVTFKHEQDARTAVKTFNGQPADGRTLDVKVVGGVDAKLGARISGAPVDVLMGDESASGSSKMRSDELLGTDARAQVLVAPPGADPKDYTPQPARAGGRGRGRGRGRRGRGAGRGANSGMDVD